MKVQINHEEVLHELGTELNPIFERSEQGVYLYLDENHKICNEKFASHLGYEDPEEWSKVSDFMQFVEDRSRHDLVSAYQDAVERFKGSVIDVTWKKKNGESLKTECILVPVTYRGHVMALHFIVVK